MILSLLQAAQSIRIGHQIMIISRSQNHPREIHTVNFDQATPLVVLISLAVGPPVVLLFSASVQQPKLAMNMMWPGPSKNVPDRDFLSNCYAKMACLHHFPLTANRSSPILKIALLTARDRP
jgi:hypothetical protein